jgi:hypothetical protein
MPPLTDPERLRCYKNALENWCYTDFVVFEELAWAWLQANLPRANSQREIARLLYRHVAKQGGVIDEQVEARELWKDLYPFHYDLRVTIEGRRVYFETCLEYKDPDDPDDPVIRVVNAHDA